MPHWICRIKMRTNLASYISSYQYAGSLFLLLHEKEDTGKTNFERSIYKRRKDKSSPHKQQLSNTTFWDYEEENTTDSDCWSDPYGDEREYYDGWSKEDVESGLADAYE